MGRLAEISIKVQLDQNNIPEKIEWAATDAGFPGFKQSDSLSISLWDTEQRQTYGIDLWTNNMMVEEMHVKYFQMFVRMADTFERATNDTSTADKIRKFANEFQNSLNKSD